MGATLFLMTMMTVWTPLDFSRILTLAEEIYIQSEQ